MIPICIKRGTALAGVSLFLTPLKQLHKRSKFLLNAKNAKTLAPLSVLHHRPPIFLSVGPPYFGKFVMFVRPHCPPTPPSKIPAVTPCLLGCCKKPPCLSMLWHLSSHTFFLDAIKKRYGIDFSPSIHVVNTNLRPKLRTL